MVGKLTPDNVLSASRAAQLEQLSPYGTVNELLAEMIAVDEGKPQPRFEGNELTTSLLHKDPLTKGPQLRFCLFACCGLRV